MPDFASDAVVNSYWQEKVNELITDQFFYFMAYNTLASYNDKIITKGEIQNLFVKHRYNLTDEQLDAFINWYVSQHWFSEGLGSGLNKRYYINL